MTRRTARDLRIVFAGVPQFAADYLDYLLAHSLQVVAVYTQPDRPHGRGKKLGPSPVKALAQARQIAVQQPARLDGRAEQAALRALRPDLLVVVAYGLLLPPAVLAIPAHGGINVHASLLPRWRGAAPIARAIEAGDRQSGVSLMQMDAGLDTGAVLASAACPIAATDTAGDLQAKLVALGCPLLLQVLEDLARGGLNPRAQDEANACYAPKISKAEGAIDWRRSAVEIERKIRAFHPAPVCFSTLRGQRIRLHAAQVMPVGERAAGGDPGRIVGVDPAGLEVQTGSGILRLTRLQLPGRKVLDCAALLRGQPAQLRVGAQFTAEAPV
ncbi:MAG: methionyl-tRNA formyltransferase [Cellvibrionales bacterium]|nr:methionyl-tRNA formyltransferase [Cellvibrionales bacterium]